jgi:hypothetical protein
MVVHADETRWSLNSVWAFLSEKARVLLFGVHKDAGTLQQVLDPATFAGILISDDAAVYLTFRTSPVDYLRIPDGPPTQPSYAFGMPSSRSTLRCNCVRSVVKLTGG